MNKMTKMKMKLKHRTSPTVETKLRSMCQQSRSKLSPQKNHRRNLRKFCLINQLQEFHDRSIRLRDQRVSIDCRHVIVKGIGAPEYWRHCIDETRGTLSTLLPRSLRQQDEARLCSEIDPSAEVNEGILVKLTSSQGAKRYTLAGCGTRANRS